MVFLHTNAPEICRIGWGIFIIAKDFSFDWVRLLSVKEMMRTKMHHREAVERWRAQVAVRLADATQEAG